MKKSRHTADSAFRDYRPQVPDRGGEKPSARANLPLTETLSVSESVLESGPCDTCSVSLGSDHRLQSPTPTTSTAQSCPSNSRRRTNHVGKQKSRPVKKGRPRRIQPALRDLPQSQPQPQQHMDPTLLSPARPADDSSGWHIQPHPDGADKAYGNDGDDDDEFVRLVQEAPIDHARAAGAVAEEEEPFIDEQTWQQMLARQQEIRAQEAKACRDAEAAYAATGDASAFEHILAPFVRDQGHEQDEVKWIWSIEAQLWYFVGRDGNTVWEPSLDSFF